MKNNLIDEMNKVLTNTLDYKEVLQKLADAIGHDATEEKLNDFVNVADRESKTLIREINEMGGDVESTERQTDHESVSWVQRPLPDAEDMQAVLACLIEAERNKEDDYNSILSHPDIPREVKNSLKQHRKEAESNLKYFQSTRATVEHKK